MNKKSNANVNNNEIRLSQMFKNLRLKINVEGQLNYFILLNIISVYL